MPVFRRVSVSHPAWRGKIASAPMPSWSTNSTRWSFGRGPRNSSPGSSEAHASGPLPPVFVRGGADESASLPVHDIHQQHPATCRSTVHAGARHTETLVAPLNPRTWASQCDASPAKWHLAHTTWSSETFLLSPFPGYRRSNPPTGYLFIPIRGLGPRQPRSAGCSPLLVGEILLPRHVDAHMSTLLKSEPSTKRSRSLRSGAWQRGADRCC